AYPVACVIGAGVTAPPKSTRRREGPLWLSLLALMWSASYGVIDVNGERFVVCRGRDMWSVSLTW
ncbi:MAG: hypothetical protein LC790_04165, partial [Actinobacteria bacterium]|nr:hypothetical protein [Actinomycetota bacterium]